MESYPHGTLSRGATVAIRRGDYYAKKDALKRAEKALKALGSGWKLGREVKSLDSLEEEITKKAKYYFGDTGKSVAPRSLKVISKQGITNLPKYLVQGFMMCGWRWGGTWSSTDAMHFEYPIPLPGVNG